MKALSLLWEDVFSRRSFLLVFLLALGIRLAYFSVVRHGPLGNKDSSAYQLLAESIRTGKPYATIQKDGSPGGFPADLQRPPGYPVFLSVVNLGGETSRARTAIMQSVLGAALAWLLAAFIARLTNPATGLVGGILYAIDGITIIHTPMLIAELFYSAILAVTIGVFTLYLSRQRPALALLAGGLLGFAALTKPVAQLQILAFALAWAWQPRRRLVGLSFLLVYIPCVTPWMIRNYYQHGLFTLSAIDTAALYFYNGLAAERSQMGMALDKAIGGAETDWQERRLPLPVQERQMREEAWRMIRQNWLRVVQQAAIGFARTCFGTGRETLIVSLGRDRPPSFVWHTLFPLSQVIALWVLAVCGAMTAFRRCLLPRSILVFWTAAILLALLPSAGPMGYSRFRLHAAPLLCIFAAIGAMSAFALFNGPGKADRPAELES